MCSPGPKALGAGARNASHLCLLALEVVELVPALAQPGQAAAVLLAQGLQLRAQLRALQAERGAVSGGIPWLPYAPRVAGLRPRTGAAVTGGFLLLPVRTYRGQSRSQHYRGCSDTCYQKFGKISFLKEWPGVGPGCPGQWWSHHPWRGSKDV